MTTYDSQNSYNTKSGYDNYGMQVQSAYPSGYSSQPKYTVPQSGYIGHPPGNFQQMTHQMTDTTVVKEAIKKLQKFCFVSIVLSVLLIISGAATLGIAAENIGFPVFNFGPLLVGLIYFTGNAFGYNGLRKLTGRELTPESVASAKCPVIIVYVVSILCITFATLSAVFSFLSGAICAGADIPFYNKNGNVRTRLDVKQYCYPNDTANTAMGFVNGVLCIITAIWCIVGCIFFCCYGRYFGFKGRHRNNC